MSKRIGIMSGTFDPIHIGHVEACLVALSACDLEQVLVTIEQKPKRKDKPTPYSKRKDMVDMALGDFTLINPFEIDAPNVTYSNTLPVLKKRFPETRFCMIVGSDMLEHIDDWDDAPELLDAFELCVVLRDNKSKTKVANKLAALKKDHPKLSYKVLPAIWSPVSSTKIRSQFAKEGESDLVHRKVQSYIKSQKLYK